MKDLTDRALNAPADWDVMRQIPQGWKLVPVEPTLDQYNAACKAYCDWEVQCQEEAREYEDDPGWEYSQPNFTHSDVYRAMLGAVPTPSAGYRIVPIEPTEDMVNAARWEDGEATARAVWRQMIAEAPTPPAEQPIDMVLHCPVCGTQHIDAAEEFKPTGVCSCDGGEGDPCETCYYNELAYREWLTEEPWTNPPHRSHLCAKCGHIWRPADVPTNGVAAVKTKGKADSPVAVPAEQQLAKSEANPPLPRDLLYAAGKRAGASEAKLRCRKCGDNYELTFNYAALRSDGVGQEGPAEQQGEQESASKLLGELLAVIHRDGGHYQAEFGTAKAVADAAQIVSSHSTTLAELRAKVEALAGTAGTDLLYRRDVLALLGDKQ